MGSFSAIVSRARHDAREIAKEKGHLEVTPDHLVLALLRRADDMNLQVLLRSVGIDTGQMILLLDQTMDAYTSESKGQSQPEAPYDSQDLLRVLSRAESFARSRVAAQEVRSTDVMVAICDEQFSVAAKYIHDIGRNRAHLVDFLQNGRSPGGGEKTAPKGDGKQEETDYLAEFTVNLNKLAAEGKLDPMIGRETELRQAVKILQRRRKNNPVLLGEPGVGKTAIVEGLAQRIIADDVPASLKNRIVRALDLPAMVAGTKYRGDFEARMKGVLKAVQEDGRTILFIDEMHTIMGAGAASSGPMDASNILKPALARGDISVIGATTYDEYRQHIGKDGAFARRFGTVMVAEPSPEDAVEIIMGLRDKFAEHHGLDIGRDAVEAAVKLSERYIMDRHLPDKAIDLIDDACSEQRLRPDGARLINAAHIEAQIEETLGRKGRKVVGNEIENLRALKPGLKSEIMGQDSAIDHLVSAYYRDAAGLGDHRGRKPVGSFLFDGPAGVGKTETALVLADRLGLDLIRIDMSEYMEKHSVSKLTGAAPGYVGYDEGGVLTDAVARKPRCVLLLDEIDKAHPDVQNVMLQVMDHGRLTDAQGKEVDFSQVVLIMTSNAGAHGVQSPPPKQGIGFTAAATVERDAEGKAIAPGLRDAFSLPFLSRVTIVDYKHLPRDVLVQIADKFLGNLQLQLAERHNIAMCSTSALRDQVARAFSPDLGARTMDDFIRDQIKTPLSEAVLFGDLPKGGRVNIDYDPQKRQVRFDFAAAAADNDNSPATPVVKTRRRRKADVGPPAPEAA